MRGRQRRGATPPKGKRSPTPQQDPLLLIRPQTAPILGGNSDEDSENSSSRAPSIRAKTPQPCVNTDESSSDSIEKEELKRIAAEGHFKEAVSQLFESKPTSRINAFSSLARILRTSCIDNELLDLNVETLSEYISKAIEHSSNNNEKIVASMMCEAFCASLGVNSTFYERVSPSFYNTCTRSLGSSNTDTLLAAVVRAYATLCYCCSDDEDETKKCMDVLERVFMMPNDDSVSEYTLAAAIESWGLLCTTVSLDVDDSKVVMDRFVEILDESDSVDVRMATLLTLGVLYENLVEYLPKKEYSGKRSNNNSKVDVNDNDDGNDDDDDEIVDCRGSKDRGDDKSKIPTLYDYPEIVDPDIMETFKKDSAVRASKKDKATEQKAFRIVLSVLLDGTEPEPVTVVVDHKKLVFRGLSKRLIFNVFKRIFEDGIYTHLKENETIMAILEYEFRYVFEHTYSADAEKKADMKRKKDRDNCYNAFFNYED